MTRQHWIELLSAGPNISEEDFQRLKHYIPKRDVLKTGVELALSGMQWQFIGNKSEA